MSLELEKTIADFLISRKLITACQNILLAVSGGADSVALMDAMTNLQKKAIFKASLTVAHINHNLRPPHCDSDQRFVVEAAAKLGLSVETRSIDVRDFANKNKLSIETAARNLRINALIDIAQKTNCSLIATAHHKNDNAETVLHRIIRGTGFRGLAGIWPKKSFAAGIDFIRPLLCVTKDDIIQYCKSTGLEFRQDHTNNDISFTRNRIRHLLVPFLQKGCGFSIPDKLATLSENCQSLHTHILNQTQNAYDDILISSNSGSVVLDSDRFANLPAPVQTELARKILTDLGSGQRDLTASHYKKIAQLARDGGTICLPKRYVISCQNKRIIFEEYKKVEKNANFQAILPVPGRINTENFTIEATIFNAENCNIAKFIAEKNSYIERFDIEKLVFPLTIRNRQKGDKFHPMGMPAEKKLGKFISAAQIDKNLRKKLAVITDHKKIIWLAPIRPSELTKITDETRKILQLKISFSPDNLADNIQ